MTLPKFRTAAAATDPCAGVKVIVASSALKNSAATVLDKAEAAGTDIQHKGGSYREECRKMPAAFACCSLWIKPVSGPWGYAQALAWAP